MGDIRCLVCGKKVKPTILCKDGEVKKTRKLTCSLTCWMILVGYGNRKSKLWNEDIKRGI